MSDEIKPQEIAALLKERIATYQNSVVSKDSGRVLTVGDGIVLIQGLEDAMMSELLKFDNGVMAMVMNLEAEHVGAVILGDDTLIKEGDNVYRTKNIVQVPVGDLSLIHI